MYAFHNPSSEPFSLVFFKDINIAKVGEGGVIRYQASKTNLIFFMVNAKVKAVFD